MLRFLNSSLGRWLALLIWMSLIFIVSGRQVGQIPAFGFYDLLIKKLSHVTAYAILMALALRSVRDWRLALAITIAYAISDEYHQTFVPTRNGTAVDVLVDTIGALLVLLWVRLRR